jgi:hypothetical protein
MGKYDSRRAASVKVRQSLGMGKQKIGKNLMATASQICHHT